MRLVVTLWITLGLVLAVSACACLPVQADEAVPSGSVLYLPIVHSRFPNPALAGRDRPALVYPSLGSQVGTLAPELVWLSTGDHWYSIEISTDPLFSTVAVSVPPSTHCGGPQFKMSLLTNLKQVTLYYWRVGYEEAGESVWSEVGWFTTPGPGREVPPAPLPAMPADGSTVSCLSPYLVWQSLTEVRMYHITLGVQGNQFTFSVLTPGAGQTVPFELLPGRTYAWHVRAFNGYAWGPESQTWVFRTPPP